VTVGNAGCQDACLPTASERQLMLFRVVFCLPRGLLDLGNEPHERPVCSRVGSGRGVLPGSGPRVGKRFAALPRHAVSRDGVERYMGRPCPHGRRRGR